MLRDMTEPDTPTSEVTVAQASEQTGISRRTLVDAIARRKLKARKIGDATSPYLIRRRDLQKWLDTREPVDEQAS